MLQGAGSSLNAYVPLVLRLSRDIVVKNFTAMAVTIGVGVFHQGWQFQQFQQFRQQ
jgi:hypothetical protein